MEAGREERTEPRRERAESEAGKITMVTRRLREGCTGEEEEWGGEPEAFPTWPSASADLALWRERRKLRTREGIEM